MSSLLFQSSPYDRDAGRSRRDQSVSYESPMVIFGMRGDGGLSKDVEKSIRSSWIPGFSLANKVEFRRGDKYQINGDYENGIEFEHHSFDVDNWGDRESYCSSLENVRGADVYIFQSFATDQFERVDEKLCSTVLYSHSLKRASCARVTIMAQMLPYFRMDLKDRPRGPLSSQAVAIQLEAAGVDRVITMDVHNISAAQNAFRINFDNLEARGLLAKELAKIVPPNKEIVVISSDEGGQKRTLLFMEILEEIVGRQVEYASGRKRRDPNTGIPKLFRISTDVPLKGRYLILFDDIIASGSTVREIDLNLEKQHGTRLDAVAVTHGLFSARPEVLVKNLSEIPTIIVTDTVGYCTWRLKSTPLSDKVHIVNTSEVWAEAVRCTRENGSISRLLSRIGKN